PSWRGRATAWRCERRSNPSDQRGGQGGACRGGTGSPLAARIRAQHLEQLGLPAQIVDRLAQGRLGSGPGKEEQEQGIGPARGRHLVEAEELDAVLFETP